VQDGHGHRRDGTVIRRGDVVTLDGATGEVMLGDIPKVEASTSDDFQTLLSWADKYRRLKVRANAETPEDAAKARELGAEGIGLCRTEHMFFASERIDHMRAMILAARTRSAQGTWRRCSSSSSSDMLELFRVDGRPAGDDPPPRPAAARVPAARARRTSSLAERLGRDPDTIRQARNDLMEVNPMLGFRGCRLSVVYPEITAMQVRAIIGAALEALDEGLQPLPEIMIPLVVNVREIRLIGDIIDRGFRPPGGEKRLPALQGRHHDGDASRLPRRRPARAFRGVHELRHQRPDADDLRLFPR
jgi:pyruvate,orthophosphate dikinase